MTQALSINRLINVSVNLGPAAAQMQNTSTLLILGSSDIIDPTERFRNYTSLAGVAADFGTSAPEYAAANLYYQQAPQPISLQIGRWAQAATAGQLRGGLLSTAQQSLAIWNAITTGAFKVAIDGAAAADITGLNFSGAANLNAVAALIQTALQVAHAGMTCVWNSVYNRFEIKSGTTGAASSVSFLTAPGSGTDISATLGMTATFSGSYLAPGIAAESALAAATLFDVDYGQGWYALTILGASDADHTSVAAYIEAATNKHIYGVSTQASGVLSSVSTTDIAYLLAHLAYKRTVVQYSSTTAYAVCSLLGRILTVDYSGNNTVITLMYKQEPGIVAETLNSTQIDALEAKNCNVFVAYNNSTAIIEKGVVASGEFLDIITGTDWLSLDIQTAIYNLLYTSTTKIPQTDAGNQLIATAIEAECSRAVRNGLLAPGIWTVGGFGSLNQNDFLPKGFYVFAPLAAQQSTADRAARKSVAIQVAAKLAGAIHTVNVVINVNR
jgi:hypothetical protein